ncbi:hypothetical protein EVA_15565 [gut metagenome]|uniref:Uncharacterized protein n=1 Tax=gut metagenome TaxID=749906 RepID=J9GA61_9ZZZZ
MISSGQVTIGNKILTLPLVAARRIAFSCVTKISG